MTKIQDLGIDERYTPTVEMLPDGWEKVDEGYYHKLNYERDIGGTPLCEWELHYQGYRIKIESGVTAESYHTVEKDPFDRLWTGVKMAHLPRQFVDSDVL
jgi:hypothetical protein